MRFKVDENLPIDASEFLREKGLDEVGTMGTRAIREFLSSI